MSTHQVEIYHIPMETEEQRRKALLKGIREDVGITWKMLFVFRLFLWDIVWINFPGAIVSGVLLWTFSGVSLGVLPMAAVVFLAAALSGTLLIALSFWVVALFFEIKEDIGLADRYLLKTWDWIDESRAALVRLGLMAEIAVALMFFGVVALLVR